MATTYLNAKDNNDEWPSFFAAFQDNPAMFFTEGGILVEKKTKKPVAHLKKTLEKLKLTVNTFHLLNSTIILKCTLSLSNHKLDKLGYEVLPVKPYLSTIAPSLQEVVLKGYHWLQWDIQSKFCGKCGHPLEPTVETTEKKCTICKCSFFPRFSPAIIVLVRNGNQILLARSPHFPSKVYSAIAGFIDIGETAETAVKREIKEEVGIEVKNISYVSSQTWPFPDSFMIAFKAEYLSGDIVLDDEEMEDARWFNVHALPNLPESASISRKLIDFVLDEIAMS